MNISSRIKALCAGTALLMLAGCGVTGTWESVEFTPEMARDEYRLFTPDVQDLNEFTRAEITLRDDGSYTADVHYGDDVRRSSGTWEKQGGRITFVDADGHSQTYQAELDSGKKRMTLVRKIEGTNVKLVLERQGA